MTTFKTFNVPTLITQFAMRAMLYEAACFPSPGLVSPVSSGAHADMDFFMFIDSATALQSTFLELCQVGIDGGEPTAVLAKLRQVGIVGETNMFESTGGVNTHKGMLFVLGILAAVSSKVAHENGCFEQIREGVMALCQGLVNQELKAGLPDEGSLTHGELTFKRFGAEGIRGEMERGLPTVYHLGLPTFEQMSHLETRDRLSHTLLSLMTGCEDSTILYRHNWETLEQVQRDAKAILELGGLETPEGKQALEDLDRRYTKKRISPGGSADLLGATVFLSFVKDYLRK